jgi:hypothetical protein
MPERFLEMDDGPSTPEVVPCADGRHRPDSVGFCIDCHVDCAPTLRATYQKTYDRALSAERALERARGKPVAGQREIEVVARMPQLRLDKNGNRIRRNPIDNVAVDINGRPIRERSR